MKINNIAKNTSILTLALIIQKVVSFTYFTILARNLSPENLGKYYFAISFTTLFSILTDFGLANVLTREIAKAPQKVNKILGATIFIKIPFSFLAILIIFLSINFLNIDSITRNLVYLSLICMILDSFTMSFFSVIRGFHNLIFESFASVVFQLIVLSFGLYALYSGKSLTIIMLALVFASLFNFLYSLLMLWKKWKIKVLPRFDLVLIKQILIISIPFGVFAIFQKLYSYLDSVLLTFLVGARYTGLYQISFKIIFALQFLPMAFTASLYPAMSSYWAQDRKQLKITFERAIVYLIMISMPISFGIIAISKEIMQIFGKNYFEALATMKLIVLAIPFIFVNFPIGSLLNACDKQKKNTNNMIIVTFLSVILNLILIPKFKTLGAGITVLVSNFFMFFLGWRWVFSIIPDCNIHRIFKTFLKSLFAVLLMFVIIVKIKTSLNIILLIFLGGFIYFTILFILKGFSKDDFISVLTSLQRKK